MRCRRLFVHSLLASGLVLPGPPAFAEEGPPAFAEEGPPAFAEEGPPAFAANPPEADRLERFQTLMTGARLVGSFTTDGDASTRRPERYVVSSAVRLAGDLWLLTTRITYGEVDLTVPVPVAVKWAGDTPVITLDSVTLPGLGTFSSRVVLDRDRYAGTWQHDAVGGHLFGRIERSEAAPTDPPAADRPRPRAAAPRQESAESPPGGIPP